MNTKMRNRASELPRPATGGRPAGPLPYILVNMAISADGKIASANRAISSLGSKHDQEHLFELRATADAVMAGARTVDSSPVTMGTGAARFKRARLQRGLRASHVRVIVSGSGSIDPGAKIFARAGEGRSGSPRNAPILVLTTRRASAQRLNRLRELADEVYVENANEIDFEAAFRWLRRRWGIKRLLCEGGGELNDALCRAGLMDELHLTICPKIVGGRLASTIADGHGASRLRETLQLRLSAQRRIGDELFLIYKRARTTPRIGVRAPKKA